MLQKAIEYLENEDVVAIPTETVYGLAGRIDSEVAIKKIFETKERPLFDPLIVHVASKKQAQTLTTGWNEVCEKLADAFWPGPLTLVLPKKDNVSSLITAGLDSVGIRAPHHELTLELIEKLGVPLAAPSANKFKKTSPTSAAHVKDEFGESVFVLDGGDCQVGIESTVLGVFENELKIYRPGMISAEALEKVSGLKVTEGGSPVSPGQLEEHYQPSVPFYLNKKEGSELRLNDNPAIAARELYASLRELSKTSESIYLIDKDLYHTEAWKAVWDRIEKALKKN
jgi:L-threonylcarbamoyladenylate synthase